MRESAKEFFSRLHQSHLKPSGYKKVRQTFSRNLGDYSERIQFQGSAFNDASRPCRFYINFGVEFHELRPRIPCRDFPETHCWTRIQKIVPGAPSHYDLPEKDVAGFAERISSLLASASGTVAQGVQGLRQTYKKMKSSRLTIPK